MQRSQSWIIPTVMSPEKGGPDKPRFGHGSVRDEIRWLHPHRPAGRRPKKHL